MARPFLWANFFMNSNAYKREVAVAAAAEVPEGITLGVGSGSTVDAFIDALAERRIRLTATVAASETSARRLREHGFEVIDLNQADEIPLYVDGADEIDPKLHLTKGGGAALTREKIIASASRRFLCIADDSKLVDRLGHFPLPIEVIPMARSVVARQLVKRGGRPAWRENVVTDNGNLILDVSGLKIDDPIAWEKDLNNIPGIVTVGLFALRRADHVLLAGPKGLRRL